MAVLQWLRAPWAGGFFLYCRDEYPLGLALCHERDDLGVAGDRPVAGASKLTEAHAGTAESGGGVRGRCASAPTDASQCERYAEDVTEDGRSHSARSRSPARNRGRSRSAFWELDLAF